MADEPVLQARVAALEAQLEETRDALDAIRRPSKRPHDAAVPSTHNATTFSQQQKWPLSQNEYTRYGRQLVLPEVGLRGHRLLRRASVLVVGAGGLGCPAAMYLAGAGVGTIGIIDGDTVELSNLHRQVLHTMEDVGTLKVQSAVRSLRATNPGSRYITHPFHLEPSNAIDIFTSYQVILDCTDRPASRYLISDSAVLTGRSLVSASALRLEGQLMVLNDPPAKQGDDTGGPCYRCIFPKPPPPEAVLTCGEGGILGPIVGVLGVLQAVETLKIILADACEQQVRSSESGTQASSQDRAPPTMLLFSGFASQQFRTVRLRSRRRDCFACSSRSPLTTASLTSGSAEYVQFCGVAKPVTILEAAQRISAKQFQTIDHASTTARTILVDVREKPHFELCKLDNSINIPFSELELWTRPDEMHDACAKLRSAGSINVICQKGNDSQLAVKKIKELLPSNNNSMRNVTDVVGGFEAWRKDVDPTWPSY
ncbi:MAG: Urmylation protein [Chrysothrix sp. TS-e1954]|nr:MAG: Urmylation protein [Chrysothrix sp. TS-e1954]